MFSFAISLLFLAKFCSSHDYFVTTLPDSRLEVNSDNNIYLQENFNNFSAILSFLSTFDDNINIFLNNSIILKEITNVTFNLSISGSPERNGLSFEEYGMLQVFSNKSINIKLENLVISTGSLSLDTFAVLSVDNGANLELQDCIFRNFSNSLEYLILAKNVINFLFVSNEFYFCFSYDNASSSHHFKMLSIMNVSNFTLINSLIKDCHWKDAQFLIGYQSNIYLRNLSISNNSIEINNGDLTFINFIDNIMILIENCSFNDNILNTPMIKSVNLLNILQISHCNFIHNTLRNISKSASFLVFQYGTIANLTNNYFEKNYFNENILSLTLWVEINATTMTFIENLSKNCLFIEETNKISIEFFSCLSNNKNFNNNNGNSFDFIGSCLRLSRISTITIDNCLIESSIGFTNIPGIIIINSHIPSNIMINSSLFKNNTFNTTNVKNVETTGCALYITNYPTLIITNSSFQYNYALIFKENSGGAALFFYSSHQSSLIFTQSTFENNYSYKRALILEFIGFNVSFQQCKFVKNEQFPYKFISYTTNIIISGKASVMRLNHCDIIGNTATNGLYFLLPQRKLSLFFENINVINNNAYLSVGFVSQFETKHLEISLTNSIFANNYVTKGAIFVYFYVCAPIVRFTFSTVNSTIVSNVCNGKSYGLLVFWIYSNNATFTMKNCVFLNNNYPSTITLRPLLSHFGIQEKSAISCENCVYSNNSAYNILFLFSHNSAIFNNVTIETTRDTAQPVFFFRQSNARIVNVTLKSNSARNILFYFVGECDVFVNNSLFFNNSLGSFLFWAANSVEIQLYNCDFVGNKADFRGDSLWFLKNVASFRVKNVSFVENLGKFAYFFYFVKVNADFSDVFVRNNDENSLNSMDFVTFYHVSCTVSLKNITINYTNSMVFSSLFSNENSKLFFENISVFSNRKTRYESAFTLFKSELLLQTANLNNFLTKSSNYLFESLQSELFLANLTIKHCGNLFSIKSSSFSLISSKFTNISSDSDEDYLSLFENLWEISINSSDFEDFRSPRGSFRLSNSDFSENSIVGSSFTNHSAFANFSCGGVFFIEKSRISFISCEFSRNFATRAGVLYYKCALSEENACFFSLISNRFANNSAQIDGGCYKFEYLAPNLATNNTFLDNHASYQAISSSFFFRLGFEVFEKASKSLIFSSFQANRSDFFVMKDVFSGREVPYEIRIHALDYENNKISEEIDAKILIDVTNEFSSMSFPEELAFLKEKTPFYCENRETLRYIGKLSAFQEKSDFTFVIDDFSVISCPSSLVFMKLSTVLPANFPKKVYENKGNNSRNEIIDGENDYFLVIPIKISSCLPGEFYNPYYLACFPCLPGYYSMKTETFSCEKCLENAHCPGKEEFLVNENYWNDANFLENIYSCNIFVGSCLGNSCSKGYEGPLCKNCVNFVDGLLYYQDFNGNCSPCPNVYLIITGYIFLCILIVATLKFTMRIFEKDASSQQFDDKKFVVKIFMNLIHIYFFTKDQYVDLEGIESPSKDFLRNLKFFLKVIYLAVPIQCFSENYEVEKPDSARVFINNVLAIALFYCFCAGYLVYLIFRKNSKEKIKEKFRTIFYILLPFLIRIIADCLAYRKINGEKLLKLDTRIKFDEAIYTNILFFLLNALLFFAILFHQNIISPIKNKHSNEKISHIITFGLRKNASYELINYITMVFFFIINIIDMDTSIKILIMAFCFFYRMFLEHQFCKFQRIKYEKMNRAMKFLFAFDYLILMFLNVQWFKNSLYPFIIIEMILFVGYLLTLLASYFGIRTIFKEGRRKTIPLREKNEKKRVHAWGLDKIVEK